MTPDASTLPISGTFILAALGFAAVSAFVTGPGIAKREIENSPWQSTCRAEITADIQATRRPNEFIPESPNLGGVLCTFYPELYDLCEMIPNVDLNAPAREAERRAREAEEARIRRATAETDDICSCATSVYIEEERLSLALYAGSGRLINPESVENRRGALSRALRNPACQREG